MISYYKTFDNKIQRLPEWSEGCYINCVSPTQEECDLLINRFNVEEDFIRAALDEEESSRIEKEESGTLIILDIPSVDKPIESIVQERSKYRHKKKTRNITITKYTTSTLAIVVTQKNIITISLKENDVINEICGGAVRDVNTSLRMQFVFLIMMRMSGKYLTYLRQIDRMSSYLEKQLRDSMNNDDLIHLVDIQKSLMYFSTSLKSNEITLEKIMRSRQIRLFDEEEDLLSDVIVEIKQAVDMASIHLNVLSKTMEAFSSIISNNLNIVMKKLAVITIVISVPEIIGSFYGMNVNGIPFTNFWFPVFFSFTLCVILTLFLYKKDLFGKK